MKRHPISILLMLPAVLLLAGAGSRAGDAKKTGWKPFLPAGAFKELSKRSITAIETIAKSDAKDADQKIEAEAAILVGYTLSVKNADEGDVAKVRGAALLAVQTARSGKAKQLVDFSKSIAAAPKTPADKTSKKEYLQELQWMMENFRGKAKGGEGLHADLQYHPKLKNLNGTEAFLGAIAGKKLSDENLDKIARELPSFAYRTAVMGAITRAFAPEKGAAQWHELSDKMRDSSIALAEAAQKKNGEGILKAAQMLENSCTQCHMVFKKN